MSQFLVWYLANKAMVLQLVGYVSGGATVLNKLVPATFGPAWLHSLLGRVALFDKQGDFSVPFVEGNKAAPAPVAAPPVAP